jgi:hypothetical protein
MYLAPHLANFGYFYDALSGEFLPPSDPKNSAQTLARLMIISFREGLVSDAGSYEELRLYKPEWAPISSVVRVCHNDDIRELSVIGDESELRVVHAPNSDGTRNIHVFTEDPSSPVFDAPLRGTDYAEIRDAVTEIAQTFFDGIPAKQK